MTLAIIAGTGFDTLEQIEVTECLNIDTAYGAAEVLKINLAGNQAYLLLRHGSDHSIAPHKINYRANLKALELLGVSGIIAVAAVGGISAFMSPKEFAIPEQIIDYTHGRAHTFFDEGQVEHIDFTCPYDDNLRSILTKALTSLNIKHVDSGVYGATQGPRFESAAEIKRMHNDGCDMVGMTAMPEAALARELNIPYATLAASANWAAGVEVGTITMAEIKANLDAAMQDAFKVVVAASEIFNQ